MDLTPAGIATRGRLLLAGACIHWSAVAADGRDTVWRCGSSYADTPCTDGRPLAIDEAPDAARREEADRATHRAQAEAARLERERLRLEAAAARSRAILIDNAPRPRQPTPEQAGPVLKRGQVRRDPRYLSAEDPPGVRKATRKRPAAAKRSRPQPGE